MLTADDFGFGYCWDNDGRLMHIDHFRLHEKNRGEGRASFVLESLCRVAYYEGADYVEVSMGGGESAERFLEKNGFRVYNKRPYELPEFHQGEYGVDAVRSIW